MSLREKIQYFLRGAYEPLTEEERNMADKLELAMLVAVIAVVAVGVIISKLTS